VLIVFGLNFQAPFAGTKPRLPLHWQRSQLGNRLIVAGDDYLLTRRQSGDQFGQMGLRFFNGDRLIHNSFSYTAGVDVRTIKELAGHADISTTMRYVHLVESNAHAAIRKLTALQQDCHKIATK
jgi:integrase